MLGLQKQFIKNYIGLRVFNNEPGKLTLQVNNALQVEDKYKQFDTYITNLVSTLEGIERTEVDYLNNRISIYYDPQKLTPQKIFRWTSVILDTLIDNAENIKKYWETDMEYVVTNLTNILQKKLLMLK